VSKALSFGLCFDLCDQILEKSNPKFSKGYPKISFSIKIDVFKVAQKVTQPLEYFGKKTCHRELWQNRPIWSHWRGVIISPQNEGADFWGIFIRSNPPPPRQEAKVFIYRSQDWLRTNGRNASVQIPTLPSWECT